MQKSLKSFITLLTLLTISSLTSWAQQPEEVRFETTEIKDNKLIYRIYKHTKDKSVDLSDLEIWDKIPSNISLKLADSKRPDIDFKILLLRDGKAKIKDGVSVAGELIEAQGVAQRGAIGLWKKPDVEPTIDSGNSPGR